MVYNHSQDQPWPEDDEDEIHQFVQVSFSSDSEESAGSSADETLDNDEWCSPIFAAYDGIAKDLAFSNSVCNPLVWTTKKLFWRSTRRLKNTELYQNLCKKNTLIK